MEKFKIFFSNIFGNNRKAIIIAGFVVLLGSLLWLIWYVSDSRVRQGYGEIAKVADPDSASALPVELPDYSSVYKMVGQVSSDVDVSQLPVYRVESGLSVDQAEKLATQLGFVGDYKLVNFPSGQRYRWQDREAFFEVNPDTGLLLYKESSQRITLVKGNLPDEEEAEKQALESLKKLGLISEPSDMQVLSTSYLGGGDHLEVVGGKNKEQTALLVEVCLEYNFGGAREVVSSHYSSCPVSVWLGSGGQLYQLAWGVAYRKVVSQSNYSIKKLDQAWRELTKGKGWVAYLGRTKPAKANEVWGEAYELNGKDFESVNIKEVGLVYVSDPVTTDLLVPVWRFEGEAKIAGFEEVFYIILYIQAV